MDRYYHILGLQPGASLAEVKRAYRTLALQFHPDRNKEPGAKERFIAITEAYNYLLSPPAKRTVHNAQSAASAEAERVYNARMSARKAAAQRYREFKQQQEKEMGRAYGSALTFLIGLLFLIGAYYFSQNIYNHWYVDQKPAEAIGWIVRMDHRHYWVQFSSEGKNVIEKFMGRRSKNYLLTPNGMPVVINGQFLVIHRKGKPTSFYVDYDHFTQKTLRMYMEFTEEFVTFRYDNVTKAKADCLALMVFNEYGVSGLADLAFMNESPLENHVNNSISFAAMEDEDRFQGLLDKCLITRPIEE